MASQTIYTLGETVLDLVSADKQMFRALPGGSMLNASVSLARMGKRVEFITELGNDKAGDLITDFLKTNFVGIKNSIRHHNCKSTLALAFLDENKNASYSFYTDFPELFAHFQIPDFGKNDILIFGSFYAVKPERRKMLTSILEAAKHAGTFIYYDVNIRAAHQNQIPDLMESYIENMRYSTVVKGSTEDFNLLWGINNPDKIFEKVKEFCSTVIVTDGGKPLYVNHNANARSYPVPEIVPVSTIGAGDNFNAGFIYGLPETNTENMEQLIINDEQINKMAGCGIAFSTEVCKSEENYIRGNFEPNFWLNYI